MLQLQAPPEVLANLKPVSLGASSNLVVGQKVGIKKERIRLARGLRGPEGGHQWSIGGCPHLLAGAKHGRIV